MNENVITKSKIVFFFGAGAEQSFKLPSGSAYTLDTMLSKKTEMYSALKEFYSNRIGNSEYVKEYRAQYLFAENSHTFKEIIRDAAQKAFNCDNCDSKTKSYAELLKQYDELSKLTTDENKRKQEDTKRDLDATEKNIYHIIVKSDESKRGKDANKVEDRSLKDRVDEYRSLKEHLAYYGAVEKDFSTISAPKKAGINRFWRLINYFWSAFFSIFFPLCENVQPEWFNTNDIGKKDGYKEILKDFPSRILEVLENYNYSKIDNDDNYYSKIKEQFSKIHVITTNYTPLIGHYFKDNNSYLAGKLSEFEDPEKLLVKDICALKKDDRDEDSFVFPFIMTQAPIKPIIAPSQIKEYAKAIEKLEEANVLVIIGYSLGESDDHINAILHDYILKDGKKLIFCAYSKDRKFDLEDEKKNVFSRLKLTKELAEKIDVIENNGDISCLLIELQNLLMSYNQ